MSYRSWENDDVIDQALPHFGDQIDSYKLIHSEIQADVTAMRQREQLRLRGTPHRTQSVPPDCGDVDVRPTSSLPRYQ
ncbi:MAG: hypothetical protein P8I99_09940 [Acidimicrobiales bacterium]|nr:hypothetical protein [Acidimicrobiales bacterium]